jgi:hypothetical protein
VASERIKRFLVPLTNFYIDGFNLYNGLARRSRARGVMTEHRWLDLRELARYLLPDCEIQDVYYFTSPIKRFEDAEQAGRQEIFWAALRATGGVTRVMGKFEKQPANRRLHADSTTSVYVWDIKEKGSDVNLASLLLHDAYEQACERAAVVSDDSDLALPVEIAARVLPAGVYVFNPNKAKVAGGGLRSRATHYEWIPDTAFAACQLPSDVRGPRGAISKPGDW